VQADGRTRSGEDSGRKRFRIRNSSCSGEQLAASSAVMMPSATRPSSSGLLLFGMEATAATTCGGARQRKGVVVGGGGRTTPARMPGIRGGRQLGTRHLPAWSIRHGGYRRCEVQAAPSVARVQTLPAGGGANGPPDACYTVYAVWMAAI
jgi:hypothetical protein